MKPATIFQLKKELQTKSKEELIPICLRLAKYKVDNKSLLTYLLFQRENESDFVNEVKLELKEQMEAVEPYRIYIAKKNIRRILRNLNKQIKYSGQAETEVELRISFCELFKQINIPIVRSRAMKNLYNGQVKKIQTALSKLHEDIQFEYEDRVRRL